MLLVFLLLLAPSFEDSFRAGLSALNRRDLAEARQELEAAEQMQPENGRVWIALAQTYLRLKESSLANVAAGNAEKFGASDAPVLHSLAIFYSESDAPDIAAGFEEKYADLAPRDRKATVQAMFLYLSARRPKDAVRIAIKTQDWEERADVRNLLGKALAMDRQYERGAAELEAARRLSPDNSTYGFDLANLYLHQEKFAEAERVLEQQRRSVRNDVQIELALGVADYGLRKFPEAIEQFLKVIALDATIVQPYLFLGKVLDQANDRMVEIGQRFEAFQKANPENEAGYYLVAKWLNTKGQESERAEALLRKALSIDGKTWEAHLELANLLEKRRAYAEAEAELQSAIRLNAKAPVPHYRLARIYERLGKPELAQAERELHQKLSTSGNAR